MKFTTHCALRLGDNLAALHFVRRCALKYGGDNFTHYALRKYIPQLMPVICDLPNVWLIPLEQVSEPAPSPWEQFPREDLGSVDLWKNAGGWWDRLDNHDDYGKTMVAFFDHAAEKMGIESPIWSARHLLFDYPALRPAKPICEALDFLIINSIPLSGQFQAYDVLGFERLIAALAKKHRVITTRKTSLAVACTVDYNLSVTEIGHLSQVCSGIVMVATGPGWPTFNIWNLDSVKLRIVMRDFEEVNLAPHTVHVRTVGAAYDALAAGGFL